VESLLKRKLILLVPVVPVVVLIMFVGGIWDASNQLLFPVWKGATKDLAVCGPQAEADFGPGCGNLRTTQEFKFSEVKVPSVNGYDMPGWRVGAQENGMGAAQGAVMLIHGGGGDRRGETRYIRFFLARGLDVLTLDLGCHGEAPCPVPGLSYGHRESRDVLSAYLFLSADHQKVYAMGTSVGAAAILIALPQMPGLTAAVAENPMASFQRLILESPAAPPSVPAWFMALLVDVTMLRGRFDGLLSPMQSLRFTRNTPIYFLHSKQDAVVPYRQTQELADSYAGPKTVWFPERGEHAALWDVDHAAYDKRMTDFLNSVADVKETQ